MTSEGYVYILGAGCGDDSLITQRGREALENCDAVVYDDLIDESLLSLAPANAQRIYMGKRSGVHSAAQEQISETLLNLAREGKRVVRLKGGDPFVFGRGGEEALALQKGGIPFEVIPGISSVIAIPELAGIPVTHRGVSRGFHVITSHTSETKDGFGEDFSALARLSGTLIFLMGLARLETIAESLVYSGKDIHTPCAVISGGNSPHSAIVRGTLGDIVRKVQDSQVQSPAVIVVGDVAAMDCTSKAALPLQGKTVGLTGTEAMAGKLKKKLQSLGASVYIAEKSVLDELEEADIDKDLLKEGTVLVFTSSNGVHLFFKKLKERKIDFRILSKVQFGVIGSATGDTLASYGFIPDFCPETATSEALAEYLKKELSPGTEIVLYRSKQGSRQLAGELKESFPLRDVPAYTVQSDPEVARQAKCRLPGTDYLCFSSAGGTNLYFDEHGSVPEGAKCVCIGEVTAKELKKHGVFPWIMAEGISAEGMVQAILHDCDPERED